MANKTRPKSGETEVYLDPGTGEMRARQFWVYNKKKLYREDIVKLPPSVRLDIANGSTGSAGL